MSKELLFTVTKNDCRFDYFKGHGAGGQKKNKTENYCRCTHVKSGAIGMGQDGRSKLHNQRTAFKKMVDSDIFQKWVHLRAAEITGTMDKIKEDVEKEIQNNIRIEVYKNNKWEIEPKESYNSDIDDEMILALEKNLLAFPDVEHDDPMDSLLLALEGVDKYIKGDAGGWFK